MKNCLLRWILNGLVLLPACPLFSASSAERKAVPERASRENGARSEIRAEGTNVDYVLQPQDVLRVFVFQHDDLNKQTESVSISKENTISLPLIKTINLTGKTVRQAEEMIRQAYDKDYLVNPQVSVMVTKYAERTVNVIGAVTNPGRVQFPSERGLTILEAISSAGGPNRYADLKKVKLTRKSADGDTKFEEINVDALMKNGGRDAFSLQKDDVVFVPERII
jgi:polysaccharide biosynthesis/export protein